MEAPGTSKNNNFVKDILKKRQSAKIVIEVAVKAPKWPGPKFLSSQELAEAVQRTAKGDPKSSKKDRVSFRRALLR